MLSVLDIFRVGIGPSSSHTVGPMRIAGRFLHELDKADQLKHVQRLEVELLGSLAFTGKGHATPKAVILGLCGHAPDTLVPDTGEEDVARVRSGKSIELLGTHQIAFDARADIKFNYDEVPDLHPNAMRLTAFDAAGSQLNRADFYSTGGGFIASRAQLERSVEGDVIASGVPAAHPFASAEGLLRQCDKNGRSIAQIVLANEASHRPLGETHAGLDRIAEVMMASINRGLQASGELPGALRVKRRAKTLWQKLQSAPGSNEREQIFDWLNAYAMAVNEENAAGGQVVTAPTNGAAGILPAVIRHYCLDEMNAKDKTRTFLLTAGGIGLLYKQRASISGAEMGCQGEVGVACSMAAGGLCAVWGGSPQQVASAAEIGMEHNLGLTCDPVGGLVQIPCIERNAIGAVKAVNAARLALHSDGHTHVSLDQVIETMRQTGLDMSSKYKETSQGGLAVNVVEC